jgi:hypothetical protein
MRQPTGDVGVLLVHGIGDHKESDTLTGFGEPLLDWLREWLRGQGTAAQADVMSLQGVRLRATRTEAESPAYARVTITVPGPNPSSENWVFSEAWWADSIQPPVALKLLKWLLSRGPLLIFWHFYLKASTRPPEKTETFRDFGWSVVAFLLAASVQLAVVVATVLWVIPIPKWRQAVVNVMRAATLTLGDSYVLLEHDIQRAALIDRVRRSLEWLAPRCTRIIVVAHSQGCAIAHEALGQVDTAKVHGLVTIGSGLEKLNFLRKVREKREGLVAAPLLVPVFITGLVLFIFGLTGEGPRWHLLVGGALLAAGLLATAALMNALKAYLESIEKDLERLRLVRADGTTLAWTDISSTHDVVPMGDGSLLRDKTGVTRVTTVNEQSYLHDHIGYFQAHNCFMPRIWEAMSGASGLSLFTVKDADRVSRFVQLHEWHVRVLAWSRRILVLAGIASLVLFSQQLMNFGNSILQTVKGSPLEDVMKPVRALAGLMAWIVQLLSAPHATMSDTLANSIVGGLTLVIALVLWWLAFKAIWRAVAVRRGRLLCRGADVLQNRSKKSRAIASCGALLMAGAVPALVVLGLLLAPQALSLNAIGQSLAAAIALVCFGGALLFAAGGPFVWRSVVEEPVAKADSELVGAVFYPVGLAILIGFLLYVPAAQWPYAGRERLFESSQPFVWAAHGLVWQLYAGIAQRARWSGASRGWWLSVFAVPPVVVALIAGGAMAHLYPGPALSGYVTAYTLSAILWIPAALLATVKDAFEKVMPAVKSAAAEHAARYRFWSKSRD